MASRGVNKAILVGNLGQEPEIKYMPNGEAVCNISVATSESWKDKTTGEQKEVSEWHRIVAFRRLAEIMGEYLHKGSKIYVEGKLKTRKWQDKEGVDRYTTEIVADQMQMLDKRQDGPANQGQVQQPQQQAQQPQQQSQGYQQAPQQQQQQARPQQQQSQPQQQGFQPQQQQARPQQQQQQQEQGYQQQPQQQQQNGYNDFDNEIPFDS